MEDSLEFKPNLNKAVERMKRFWNLEEPLDRIPVIVHLPMSDQRKADGSFFGKMNNYIEFMEEYFERHSVVMDEYFPEVEPQYGHAIISALCGSKIKSAAHTVWSTPIIDDMSKVEELSLDWNNEWGRKFREDYEYLLYRAKGKYTVGLYEIEGVSDTLSALRGTENIFYDFHENPSEAFKFAERVTDILIEFGKWSNVNVGEKQDILGGTTNGYCLWMPKGSCNTAEDATVMFSCEYYRKYIKKHTERLTSSFSKTLIEVHKEGAHQIREFGKTKGISMMTVENLQKMNENHRNDMEELLGKMNFFIYVNPDQIEEVLKFTGVKGIMLVTSAISAESASDILNKVENLTEKCRRQMLIP